MHSGPSRPLRQLYQNPYCVVSEVVNLKCYLLSNLGHVVKTTPIYHRFGGSRYTLIAKRELWSNISPISTLRWKLRHFACSAYTTLYGHQYSIRTLIEFVSRIIFEWLLLSEVIGIISLGSFWPELRILWILWHRYDVTSTKYYKIRAPTKHRIELWVVELGDTAASFSF